MATGITFSATSGENLNTTQKTMIAAAKLAFEPAAPEPGLVLVEQLQPGHYQHISAIWARLTQASAVVEENDLSQVQKLASTPVTINPSEHGIIVTLHKRLIRRQGDINVITAAADLMGMSIRIRASNDIIDLFDSFTKSVPGATNSLDIGHFRGSVAYVLTDNSSSYGPAPMPLHADLHIEQISDIILDISDTGSATTGTRPAGFGDDLLKRWWKGNDRLYGVSIFHGGNISRDTSDDSKGALFNRGALLLVDESGVEPTEQIDESSRLREFGMFKSWGESMRIDEHGVEIYSDTLAVIS